MVGDGVRIRTKKSPSPNDPPQLTFPEHPATPKKDGICGKWNRSPVPLGQEAPGPRVPARPQPSKRMWSNFEKGDLCSWVLVRSVRLALRRSAFSLLKAWALCEFCVVVGLGRCEH